MKTSNLANRLAVCSWSVQPATPEQLFQSLETIGIPRVQLALDPLREQPDTWGKFVAEAARRGVTIVSGMFGMVGEDYSTLETIKATGGVIPDATWEQNWKNIQQIVTIAAQLGLKLVTFHAGFLPHEESDPNFAKLFKRICQIADLFSQRGISLGFETGQETADTLSQFLKKLNRPTVGVNFDPANMILYAKGDPIAALRTLAPWLKQCHIKDANLTQVPGTWGEEVVVGTGQVNWKSFFATLGEVKFDGDLCIEREAGNQRVVDIRAGKDYVAKLA
jgi:L-ribulose-5-phosphate 3-epimerase